MREKGLQGTVTFKKRWRRVGAVVIALASHHHCSRCDSWTWRHMLVEFVFGSPLYFKRFFSRFPLSSKTNIS